MGPPSILACHGAEVVGSVAGSLHHCRQGILGAVGGARRQGIEDAGGIHQAERQGGIARVEGGIMAVEELVADAGHGNTLARIAESLAATDEQHVVVRVAAHRRLVGRLERLAQVLTEVHGKVGQVLYHHSVVARGQLADGLEFLLVEAHPRGIVGIAVDDAADVSPL